MYLDGWRFPAMDFINHALPHLPIRGGLAVAEQAYPKYRPQLQSSDNNPVLPPSPRVISREGPRALAPGG
ncbi:hypothetical protein GQ53DRAFT_752284 [Thozetella sp. PMI_491]|nr:hypothetical protein GQ53DRAFT_752284 [Thozetella sp. PMI_491]